MSQGAVLATDPARKRGVLARKLQQFVHGQGKAVLPVLGVVVEQGGDDEDFGASRPLGLGDGEVGALLLGEERESEEQNLNPGLHSASKILHEGTSTK